jgi:hypothetical protein
MGEIYDGTRLPADLQLGEKLLSIFSELAGKKEDELRCILRPHDDAGFGPDDNKIIDLRERLDDALGRLTKLEIACELGLYGLNSDAMKAYLGISLAELVVLVQFDAFLRYLGVYLYFGVQILAGRIDPPPWWDKKNEPFSRDPTGEGYYVNKRPLQLAVPPGVGDEAENEKALARFLTSAEKLDADAQIALKFLDGFHPDLQHEGFFDYEEPAEFELWLRGLRPDTDKAGRFASLQKGLTEWAHQHARFYISLEPLNTQESWAVQDVLERRRPKDGWVITNPVAARIALADFYWLARLLRAEVSASGQVSYAKTSWMHVLNFEAVLHKKYPEAKSLRDDEEVLRSVFDYVCDLVLNAVELSEDRQRRFFEREEYPEPQEQVKQWRTVFDEELREVKKQKDSREYRTSESEKLVPGPAKPTNDWDVWSERLLRSRDTRHRIGLGFSGGGIRSATFNLGVLQGLQELDLLRHVDYLSTVSGGGFIGSWLVGNARRSRHWLGRLTCWDESVAHLRSYSNYLAPLTGILSADTWTLGASWVRNAFLVQLSGLAWLFAILSVVLIAMKCFLFAAAHATSTTTLYTVFRHTIIVPHLGPFGYVTGLVSLVIAGSLLYSFSKGHADTVSGALSTPQVRWLTVFPSWIGSFVLASALWSTNWDPLPCSPTDIAAFPDYSKILARVLFRLPWIFLFHALAVLVVGWVALAPLEPKDRAAAPTPAHSPAKRIGSAILASLLCTIVLYLELCAVIYLFLKLRAHFPEFGPQAFVLGPSLVLLSFTVSVVLWIGLSGRFTSDEKREWWTRYGAWLTMFGIASFALSTLAIFGPWLMVYAFGADQPGKHPRVVAAVKWTSVLSWLGTVVGGLFAGNSSKTGDRQSRESVPLDLLARAGGLLFILAFVIATATTLYLFLKVWAAPSIVADPHSTTVYWNVTANVGWLLLVAVFVVMVICGWIFSWYFDINIFGLSRFYQFRLVRCYLGATRWKPGVRKPHPFTGFDLKDDLLLSELKGDYTGPYPIMNCTLNLAGSSDLALNTRHSASFSLTPNHCGADRPKVGYVETGQPGAQKNSFAGGVSLGQATAISGAAASPNMGYNTSPVVAFLLTMFNVRLGWWLPNPGQGAWKDKRLGSSLYYLTRELLGTADERRRFLNVSDGGHFENLAIYELIRRRCTVIIASDAECDELLQFGGLGNVLRICGTDFGAQIDIDVKSIRAQKAGHSLAHSAVGKIKYDNGSIGYLIYLKASVTGDEDPSIAQYRTTHPTFPHETTADQFFTEDQFESYRKLGAHVVKHSFRGTQIGQQPFEVAEQMYDTLAPAGCSSEVILRHTQTLERVWEQFRVAPGLNLFLQELMVGPAPPAPRVALSQEELCMALELTQLMEEVFLDLQLDDFWDHPDNRGWAVMFMRWARSPRFQQAWKETRRTYGIRFEYFCAARLGLERDKPILRI